MNIIIRLLDVIVLFFIFLYSKKEKKVRFKKIKIKLDINFLFSVLRRSLTKAISMFLCLTLAGSLFGNTRKVQAYENNKGQLSVKESITINGENYTVETIVNYKRKSNVVEASGDIVTRGEWISNLLDAIGVENQEQLENDDLKNTFSDIDGHEYEDDILYSIIYSIVDT
ncbi:hypothetical protein [Clostridium isatidis]|uniref:hypothetical protein n=1 Tax=Clostridium isatidis TaxID=182773 RepID=UPI003AAEC136